MGASVDSEPSLTTSQEAARAAPAGLEPGERDVVADRYRLLEFIAEGGMGAVYVAEHVLSRKKLALKVVHPYLCKGRQGVERFRREVSAAAEIDHPGIVQVYDAGVDDDGGFFMAMELLRGESMGDLLRREWPGMATSVALVEQMLEPLAKAHARGFIHRDLKPDNVFLAVDDEGRRRVKILDFGLAREVEKGGPTRTGITFGTPEYMSPEQAISARKVRAPGDVWSVAVMLYELLSGTHPFDGETANAIMANAIKEPLPALRDRAPHVPAPLAELIERSLAKEPEERPQTAGEMLEQLRSVRSRVELDETVPEVAPEIPFDSGDGEASSSPHRAAPSRSGGQRAIRTEVASEPGELRGEAAAEVGTGTRRRTPRWKVAAAIILGAVAGLGLAAFGGARLYGALSEEGPSATAAVGPATGVPRRVEDTPRAEPERGAEPQADPTSAAGGHPPADRASGGEDVAAAAAAEAPQGGEPSQVVAAGEADLDAEAANAGGQGEAALAGAATAEAPPAAARRRSRPSPRASRRVRGPSPLQRAQECMRRGDSACAREALVGRARTAQELAMLISLHQSANQMPQALDAMERYVSAYPDGSRAGTYRAFLSRYGR